MRCKSCNEVLSGREAGRKDRLTGDFIDLCNGCYPISEMAVSGTFTERPDWEHWELTEAPLNSVDRG